MLLSEKLLAGHEWKCKVMYDKHNLQVWGTDILPNSEDYDWGPSRISPLAPTAHAMAFGNDNPPPLPPPSEDYN